MNLLKTSFLALVISLCVFACKPDDEPKPNNSSNTGNNPSQNTSNNTNNQTNPGNTNDGLDTIYSNVAWSNAYVLHRPLPLSDSCKIVIKVTNGFNTSITLTLQSEYSVHPKGNLFDYEMKEGPSETSNELKPGESYVFNYESCEIRKWRKNPIFFWVGSWDNYSYQPIIASDKMELGGYYECIVKEYYSSTKYPTNEVDNYFEIRYKNK